MLDGVFASVWENGTASMTTGGLLGCTACSLILGMVIAGIYMFRSEYTKSFVLALSVLPMIVQMVILMVNGNLGAGVAVAGTFSLVRFRSAPGTAKEIVSIFLSMAVGLATGMGYLGVAVFFVLVVGGMELLFAGTPWSEGRNCNDEETDFQKIQPSVGTSAGCGSDGGAGRMQFRG